MSIHLEGMNEIPSLLAYYHLYDCLHGKVIHVSLYFHLDDVPHNGFETQMDNMLAAFERKGQFQEYVSITFIVMRLFIFS